MMDNAAYHHTRVVRRLLAVEGVTIMYVSPYSPNLSPVELLFSWIKHGDLNSKIGGLVKGKRKISSSNRIRFFSNVV